MRVRHLLFHPLVLLTLLAGATVNYTFRFAGSGDGGGAATATATAACVVQLTVRVLGLLLEKWEGGKEEGGKGGGQTPRGERGCCTEKPRRTAPCWPSPETSATADKDILSEECISSEGCIVLIYPIAGRKKRETKL